MNELDPQIKLVLEQLKAKAAQNPASATPLSEQERILAMRRMMQDFIAARSSVRAGLKSHEFGYTWSCWRDPHSLIRPPQ
jgi:hypothetical protein